MAMEKILEGIELNHPLANENSTYDVFIKDKSAKKPIFVVTENNGTQRLMFELSGDFKQIAKNFRKPILTYRLGTITDEDKVSVADVFMYGKFNLLVDHNLD